MFRTGVLLDRSITNVAIVFHVSAECEDECQSDEDPSDGRAVSISHVMAVRSKLEEKKQMVMDDTFVQPCLQESEDWPRLYHDIEVQRERLEEMGWFELGSSEKLMLEPLLGKVLRIGQRTKRETSQDCRRMIPRRDC